MWDLVAHADNDHVSSAGGERPPHDDSHKTSSYHASGFVHRPQSGDRNHSGSSSKYDPHDLRLVLRRRSNRSVDATSRERARQEFYHRSLLLRLFVGDITIPRLR
jgi:hypothetical protein